MEFYYTKQVDQRSFWDKFLDLPKNTVHGNNKNPYDVIKGFEVVVDGDVVALRGKVPNPVMNIVANLAPVAEMNNFDNMIERYESQKVLSTQNLETKTIVTETVEPRNIEREYREGDVFFVWFKGQGAEFNGAHPAIFIRRLGKDLLEFVPCSTKRRDGKKVETFYFNDILKDEDSFFKKKSAGKLTYALVHEGTPVDESKVGRYLGYIEPEAYKKIFGKYPEYIIKEEEVVATLKEHFTFTIDEEKLLGRAKQSEIVDAINSSATFENKVDAILSAFSMYPNVETAASILSKAIVAYKTTGEEDFAKLVKDASKGKKTSTNTALQMVRKMLRKKLKNLYAEAVESFIPLVSKLATEKLKK